MAQTQGKLRGYLLGVMAAASYGTIPLFTLPLYGVGMNADSILLLRYLLAILVLGVMLRARGHSFRVGRRDLLWLAAGGVMMSLSSITLFASYLYMPAGIASTLLFVYPIMVAVIMAALFHEKIGLSTVVCLAAACGGDMRKALGSLEFAVAGAAETDGAKRLTTEAVRQVAQRSSQRYDKSDDMHYDCISALQKSIRGSDPDAAVHYLARILEAGDLLSACRRLLVIAAEDVGLAYPQAIPIVKACVDSALQLGLPEARLPLAQAIIAICESPKSNSVCAAVDAAMADAEKGGYGAVPVHLRDTHYAGHDRIGSGDGYKYPHDYPGHYVRQNYMPVELQGKKYYFPSDMGHEATIRKNQEIREGCK